MMYGSNVTKIRWSRWGSLAVLLMTFATLVACSSNSTPADSFSDGLAIVQVGDKYGFIDESGKFVINPQFKFAYSFTQGLARVLVGDMFGFIDKSGKIVINPQFDDVSNFGEDVDWWPVTDNRFIESPDRP